MLLDHIIMTIVAVMFAIPILVNSLLKDFEMHQQSHDTGLPGSPVFYVSLLGFGGG